MALTVNEKPAPSTAVGRVSGPPPAHPGPVNRSALLARGRQGRGGQFLVLMSYRQFTFDSVCAGDGEGARRSVSGPRNLPNNPIQNRQTPESTLSKDDVQVADRYVHIISASLLVMREMSVGAAARGSLHACQNGGHERDESPCAGGDVEGREPLSPGGGV